MEIEEIKKRLSIVLVLSHYGISIGRNGMINCPFHEDKKVSMKVYVKTNTVYCFAGSCGVEHLDVIDFIMQMEKCTKHEAILKAKEMVDVNEDTIESKEIRNIKSNQVKLKGESAMRIFTRYIKPSPVLNCQWAIL